MTKLQGKRLHFAGKPELLGFRKNFGDLICANARTNQIEASIDRPLQTFFRGKDADHLSFGADETDRRCNDQIVDPDR